MKKLVTLLVLAPYVAFAQNIKVSGDLKLPAAGNWSTFTRPYVKTAVSDAVAPAGLEQSNAGVVHHYNQGGVRDITSVEIGITTYDLQTNNAVYPRLFNNGDGTYSAVWTMSKNSNWSDRGTGYNYFDGNTWGVEPSVRLETQRTGFTNVCLAANGNELVLSHTAVGTNPGALALLSRTPKGSGTWGENASVLPSPSPGGLLWSRMVRGGTDNNTIHVIVLTQPVANPPGTIYKGQDGALLYSRSLDGGNTWDKVQVSLPGIDSSEYAGFGGDTYAIDANGNTVAIVIGGFVNDWILLKSTDNGETWTKTVIWEFPIPFYENGQLSDYNEDGIADTIETNDGSVAVLVDENEVVHTWAGYNRMFNDGSATGFYYFPGLNGLMYWNDDIGDVPVIIAGAQDIDGSGELEINALGSSYGCGLCSFPSAGMDQYGNIYLSYWAIVENTEDPSGNALGHSYLIYSRDKGETWSSFDGQAGAIDFTTDDGVTEGCFSSIVRHVDDAFIYVVSQEDACAGQGVTTSNGQVLDPCNTGQTNLIVVKAIDNFVTGVPSVKQPAADVKVYPVPSQGLFTIEGVREIAVDVTVTNAIGQIVSRTEQVKTNGELLQLDLTALNDGFYTVQVEKNGTAVTKPITVYKQQ
jgi:hypothetical protein